MSNANNEEKNVPDAVRNDRFASMEKVMTILYCRHAFQDFRKPVEVSYPHLAQTYHSLVKRPMDLGTLLLKTKKKEVLTIQEFRVNLQLVHSNALLFNEGAPLMEAISKHLELFSQGLFEEIIRFPYYVPTAKANSKPVDFQLLRLEKRRKRFMLVREQALSKSEIVRLAEIFSECGELPVDAEESLSQLMDQLAQRQLTTADVSTTVPSAASLRALLGPLILTCTEASRAASGLEGKILVESFCDAQTEEKRSYGEHRVARDGCAGFLAGLEESLGQLSVLMEERILRGTPYSSIWASPSAMFVYAQSISMTATSSEGRSRSPWWPCMVIACDAATVAAHAASVGASNKTSNSLGLQAETMRANLARIPADILKQLNKLRPRTSNVTAQLQAGAEGTNGITGDALAAESASNLSAPEGATVNQYAVPEGYLLLEYFGAHDFGWVRAESVSPVYNYTPTADGRVYISKNNAPGKLCNKDIVAESAEAWAALQKERRRDGLHAKSAFAPLTAAALADAADVTMTTEDTMIGGTGNAEEEDISFAPAAAASGGAPPEEVLSQDSDSEDSDQHDLPQAPSLNDLEESVDIPFSNTLFESNGVAEPSQTNSTASTAPTVKSSRSSGGRSRKSAGATDSDIFDNLPSNGAAAAASSTFYVPGPRRGSFIPAAGQSGSYFAPDREDKRLYYASPEELMRFRANVEYVLPEDVTLEDFKNCVEEGKFKTSRCPLPLPTLRSESASPVKAKPPQASPDGKEMKDELIVVDTATQATFRPKALLRTRALSYYLSCVRPLHLEHYSATPSKKGFPALPPSLPRTSGIKGNDAGAENLLISTDPAPPLVQSAEDPNKKKIAGATDIVLPNKPEKRKYVFKNRPVKLPTPATTSVPEECSVTEPVVGEVVAAVSVVASAPAPAPLPPISAASIHVPANLTLSSSCFLLDAGCSRYATGDGSVYTRTVNTDAKVFHMEAKTCWERKRILRDELTSLQAAIDALQQVSQQRQLRENERKIRFQQLQQQQLQQQLHQQQYALQQQQQNQQYLMQLIDQQQKDAANGGLPGAAKKMPSKSKPPLKPMVPVAGGNGAAGNGAKPRSRPVVVFNAAGNPTIVRATSQGAASVSSQHSSSESTDGATAPVPFTIPAPRKKSRLGDIDLSKATILTAQQHAAEQPKHPHKRAKVKLTMPKPADAEGTAPPAVAAHLSTPQASTNALDFLASVAMESGDVQVDAPGEEVGYKRSFGSISSPPTAMSINSPAADSAVATAEVDTY